jgi:hypothetical protein
LKEECGICKRVLSYNRLKRCARCNKLYCYDCMTPDVSTGDRQAMLCLNCARRTVSPTVHSKFEGLTGHLKFRAAFTSIVKLSFARIDGLIGTNLPMEAYRNETWWNNSKQSAHAKGWLDAGWEVQQVNLKEGNVVFVKVRQLPKPTREQKRKKAAMEISKPFTPVPVRPLKSNVPSNTKASKLYARILNLERQRKQGYGKVRGFKSRSRYEKRLFGSDEKPQ